MLGDKGQGALEYLLILAAVLAIAVIVILVAHQVSTPAQQSALINEDKYSCAQAGIELVNYNSLPPSGVGVVVKYQGKEYTCASAGGYYLDTNSGDEVFASCKIHTSDGTEEQLSIARAHWCGYSIPELGGCPGTQNISIGCFAGEFAVPGSGKPPNWQLQ